MVADMKLTCKRFLSALCCYSGLMFLVCGLQEDSWKGETIC